MSKKHICGIYAIKNTVNGKMYIGSSKSVHYRWKQQHYHNLSKGNHSNSHLQHAWNKYSESAFVFQVIEECEESSLIDREEHWIEHYKSWNREHGYNLARFAEGRMVMSEETRQKIREGNWKHEIPWKEFQEKVLDLYKQGVSKNKIAKILKSDRPAVYTCLELNGLYKNEGKGSIIKLTPENKQKILDLREQKLPWDVIFKQTGISKTQFYRAMKIKDGQYGGTTVNRSAYRTLTPEVENKIKELHAQGKSWTTIAKETGISRETIYAHGLPKQLGRNKEKQRSRRPFTPDMREEAMQLRQSGLTLQAIADNLGVSMTTLRNYKVS